MLFHDEINPFTGHPTGRKILNPLVRDGLLRPGFDPDVLREHYHRSRDPYSVVVLPDGVELDPAPEYDDDPTIIDGTVVRRALTPPEG